MANKFRPANFNFSRHASRMDFLRVAFGGGTFENGVWLRGYQAISEDHGLPCWRQAPVSVRGFLPPGHRLVLLSRARFLVMNPLPLTGWMSSRASVDQLGREASIFEHSNCGFCLELRVDLASLARHPRRAAGSLLFYPQLRLLDAHALGFALVFSTLEAKSGRHRA